jgi:integrase
MNTLDQYVHAATRDNTRRSYQSAIRHFEIEWGGYLPATADSVARYLVEHAESLSINTLRQRLAALAQWHIDQGFPDPTKTPIVRKVLRGIQALHPAQEKRAKPFQLEQLEQVTRWLEGAMGAARANGLRADELRHTRDKALLLLGFWRGFRGDELTRLQVEYVEVKPGEGMTCFFPQTKGDRQFKGTTFKAPALSRLCPVAAYSAWIELAGLTVGPVFRAVDQWGHMGTDNLHTDSLVPLLRSVLTQAGIESASLYSGHSLRRGFATWATANGWDLKTLMEYVGWKNVQSAMRYVESADPFARHRIEAALQSVLPSPSSTPLPGGISSASDSPTAHAATLNVTLSLERYTKRVRGMKRAHEMIEEICFGPHQMQRLNKPGHHYRLMMFCPSSDDLDETVMAMLDEMHRIAASHYCFIEVSIHDDVSGKYWN